MRVLAAPDKFRGTASASDIAAAMANGAQAVSAHCDQAPLADGGEGTLEALGGPNRSSVVTGPLDEPLTVPWRLVGGVAVIEMALASGLAVAGGAVGNDPINATSVGTGELIAAAVGAGARRVVVAVGGSATTDGGWGALQAMPSEARMRGVEIVVACDVRTRFLDAAGVFGPQKGATPTQVEFLSRRLERLAQVYERDHGIDVTVLDGSGAAGGLAGGLAARGASLVNGFEVVAEQINLWDRMEGIDLVITGEGRYDATSLQGKVVGEVARMAVEPDIPVLAVVGSAEGAAPHPHTLEVIALDELFGPDRAVADPCGCVQAVVTEALTKRSF